MASIETTEGRDGELGKTESENMEVLTCRDFSHMEVHLSLPLLCRLEVYNVGRPCASKIICGLRSFPSCCSTVPLGVIFIWVEGAGLLPCETEKRRKEPIVLS